jgi:hypothetical protein
VPSAVYLELVARAAVLGWSEGQIAKYLVFHGMQNNVTDDDLMRIEREAAQSRADALRKKQTVKPLF